MSPTLSDRQNARGTSPTPKDAEDILVVDVAADLVVDPRAVNLLTSHDQHEQPLNLPAAFPFRSGQSGDQLSGPTQKARDLVNGPLVRVQVIRQCGHIMTKMEQNSPLE